MAITYRSQLTTDSASTTGTSQAISMALSGLTNGDLLFLHIITRTGALTTSSLTNSGWTLLANTAGASEKYYLFWKIALDEPSTYTATYASGRFGASVYAFYNQHPSNPIDIYSNTGYTTSNTNLIAATMSASSTNPMLVFFGGLYASVANNINAATGPGSFTEPVTTDGGNTTSDVYRSMSYLAWTGTGNTGDMTATCATATTTKHAFAVAIRQTPAAGTVTASAVTDILTKTATGNGNVTAEGGGSVTDKGVCWNQTGAPTIADNYASSGQTGTGAYTANITGLTSNTHYYVRAYAYNGGYFYSSGAGVEFDTDIGFNDIRQDIIDGLVSAQSETHGWNNDVIAALSPSNIVRASDTQVIITLPTIPTYLITANETVTVTVPASAVAGASPIVASPTFTINDYVPPPTSLVNCTIDVTNVAPGNRWCSTVNPEIFEYNTFLGSSTSGHAIRITAAGTYDFSGNTFTDFGPAGRNFSTSASGVDAGNDIITMDAAHGYSNGDPIFYQKQGGTQNVGLSDGAMYYVNAQSSTTLSFYTTSADATTDTNRVNLSVAGSETHYIYSAGAAIYNDTGGVLTLNITNGGDTPSVRNSNGGSIIINNAVTLKLTVKDEAGFIIQGASAAVYTTNDDTELMNTTTNTNGIAQASYNYTTDTDIYIRVRKASSGDTKYLDYSSSGTITTSGYTATVTMIEDMVVEP